MVKTVVLTGKEVCVQDLGGFNTVVHNLGEEVIYASKYPNVIMGADNVAEIPQGAAKLISTTNGTVYLLGAGKAELTGQDHDGVNFRAPSSCIGGDGSSIAIKQYVNTALSSVNNALLKKADKSEIPTTLPANGGNADTVNGHTVKSDVPADAKFTDTVYSLPAATKTALGGVKVGDNLSVAADGTLSAPIYSNPNLLDNPDFRINQRGQTTYSSFTYEGAYTVDRWGMSNGTLTLTGNGGVTYTLHSETAYGDISQIRPDDGVFGNYTTTFSTCINNQIFSITSIGDYEKSFTVDGFEVRLIAYKNSYRIRVFGKTERTINIAWMKLELGNVATPFVPPSPAEELLKCMYYYERRLCPIETLADNDATWFAGITFAVPKRTTATVRYTAIYYNGVDVSTDYFDNMSAVYVAAPTLDPTHSGTAGLKIVKGALHQNDRFYSVLYEASAEL